MNYLKCVVPGCDFKERQLKKFHQFPKDPGLCQVWVDFCNLAEKPGGKHSICDRHFEESAYLDSFKILGRSKKYWKLKRDAIPTLYGPNTTTVVETMVVEELPQIIMDTEELLPDSFVEQTDVPPASTATTTPCRLCLSETYDENAAVNLFEESPGHISVNKYLMQVFQLELENSPGWPSVVCGECMAFMEQMNNFKEIVLSSHCFLYKQLKKPVPVEEQPPVSIGNEIKRKPPREDPYASLGPDASKKMRLFMKERKLLNCLICGSESLHYRVLFDHFRARHGTSGYIFCCGEKHVGATKALDHVAFHLDNDVFKCSICGRRLKKSSELNEHMAKEHRGEQLPQCETCGKTCANPSRLRKHMLIHVPKEARPYKCSYCQAGFIDKPSLRRHVERMHEVMERHKCETCGKSFSNSSTLWEHVRSAHKAQTTVCDVCGKTVRNIRLHQKVHRRSEGRAAGENAKGTAGEDGAPDAEDIIKCPVCEQQVAKSEMRRHSLQHTTGPSSYCNICHIRIKSGGTYRTHMDDHDNKEYPCPFCSRVFDKYRFRYNHIKTNHWEAHQEQLQQRKDHMKGLKYKTPLAEGESVAQE